MRLAIPDLVSNSYFPAIAAAELGYFHAEGLDYHLAGSEHTDRDLERERTSGPGFEGCLPEVGRPHRNPARRFGGHRTGENAVANSRRCYGEGAGS